MYRILFLLFLFLPFRTFSQKIIFCEGVDHLGNPKNESNEFTVGMKGGFFKVLVKLNKEVGSETVVYDVYSIQNGKESFENSLQMEVQPAITWFFKEITFYKPGDYHVYVYDKKDRLLGVGKVKVKQK